MDSYGFIESMGTALWPFAWRLACLWLGFRVVRWVFCIIKGLRGVPVGSLRGRVGGGGFAPRCAPVPDPAAAAKSDVITTTRAKGDYTIKREDVEVLRVERKRVL